MGSKKLVLVALLGALTLSLAPACSSGDDGGGTNTPDANTTGNPDASTGGTPDAMDNPMVTGLGHPCQGPSDCDTTAPDCVALSQTATQGFCTVGCGNTPDNTAAPTGGNAICQGAYMGTTPTQGTPLCALTAAGNGGTVDWSCGVACGDLSGNDLGGCPGGLTCTDNLCQ